MSKEWTTTLKMRPHTHPKLERKCNVPDGHVIVDHHIFEAMKRSGLGYSSVLLHSVEEAIVALSVHPAGCVEWTWYENLCLEVADNLENAVKVFKAACSARSGGTTT